MKKTPIILSLTALVMAVLGTSPVGQAAKNAVLPKSSVGSVQLKKDAVTSAKVRNGSLTAADFRPGTLGLQGPAGPKGDPGAAGPKGDTGPIGPAGVSGYEIVVAKSDVAAATWKSATAHCPAGKKVLGGGASVMDPVYGGERPKVVKSTPLSDTAWQVAMVTEQPEIWSAHAYAICAAVQ